MKNIDRGHCPFLKSTWAIRLFKNWQGNSSDSNRGHCHFLKSTGDIGDPRSRAPQLDPPHVTPLTNIIYIKSEQTLTVKAKHVHSSLTSATQWLWQVSVLLPHNNLSTYSTGNRVCVGGEDCQILLVTLQKPASCWYSSLCRRLVTAASV